MTKAEALADLVDECLTLAARLLERYRLTAILVQLTGGAASVASARDVSKGA